MVIRVDTPVIGATICDYPGSDPYIKVKRYDHPVRNAVIGLKVFPAG
jgi:hypothetical protein